MALSPDGRWLAVGGFLERSSDDAVVGDIRLYDFTTGRLAALLKGHRNAVDSLAFSPDSVRLVSGSGDNIAIVWRIEALKPLYALKGHGDAIYGVAYNRDGSRVATASDDHTVRIWNSDGQPVGILKGHSKQVHGVAFSPVDGTIVSTSWDRTVKFWDGTTGRLLRSINVDCGWKVIYAADGSVVVCSTGYVINALTGNYEKKHKPSSGGAVAIAPSKHLAATGDEEKGIRIWDFETGSEGRVLAGTGRNIWALGFSEDSCRLAWGQSKKDENRENDRGEVQFEASLPCAGKALGAPRPLTLPASAYSKPVTALSGYELVLDGANAGNMYFLQLRSGRNRIVTLDARRFGFRHQVYSFTPDGREVLSGGANGFLTAYEIPSGMARPFIGHTGYVYALAISPDGRLVASGATDQTINLWNLRTRELIASFFYGADGEWVAWTPQGYYNASANGDAMVGWQINRGPDKARIMCGRRNSGTNSSGPDIVDRAIVLASAAPRCAKRKLRPSRSPISNRTPATEIHHPVAGKPRQHRGEPGFCGAQDRRQ